MELKITAYFSNTEHGDISASAAEMGQDAGKTTWANATREAVHLPLIETLEQINEAKAFFKGFGAWDDEEIAGWSSVEVNALLMQYISGDIREAESLCSDDNGEIDWNEYEALSAKGTINGSMYKNGDDIFYSIDG